MCVCVCEGLNVGADGWETCPVGKCLCGFVKVPPRLHELRTERMVHTLADECVCSALLAQCRVTIQGIISEMNRAKAGI